MEEVIFLLALGFVYLVFASIQDLRKREVANWLSFSLIIFALGYRFFYSLFLGNFNFFYQGLIGLAIFFILGNLLYYGRMFAGGDAKLMIALGAVLPLSENLSFNLKIFAVFFLIFLLAGGIYGLIISFVLAFGNSKNFKKEFFSRLRKNRKRVYVVMILGIIMMLFGFIDSLFFILGILVFIFPYFYIYAKSVDEACMVKKVNVGKLTEGDWLYEDLKIGKKVIQASWEGLSKNDIQLIQRNKRTVFIRQGIAFVPVFLISFVILVLFYFLGFNLWNSFW